MSFQVGLESNSVEQHLSSVNKALSLVSTTEKKNGSRQLPVLFKRKILLDVTGNV